MSRLSRARVLGLLMTAVLPAMTFAESPVYKDASAPTAKRVDDLLSRMSIDEKIAQLRCLWIEKDPYTTNGQFDPAKADKAMHDGIGGFGPFVMDAAKQVPLRNAIQKFVVEKTNLGIPILFHGEACHGLLDKGASSFPAPIGIASSWDPALLEQVYTAASAEMRSRGISHALAPVVDICREPRWGRFDETLGEDGYLNGTLGAAIVRGLQGSDNGTVGSDHVAATLKHFVGHGQPESGINRAASTISTRDLLDEHVEPFRIAINQSKPRMVMPAYVEFDGVPAHASTWLLQDVLRKDLGFDGAIVSDYDAVEYLSNVHHITANATENAYAAFSSGVDMNLPGGASYKHLKELVDQKRITTEQIDASVRRILQIKFDLGLFENPYADLAHANEVVNRPATKTLARKAADESLVLLKNDNNLLPLLTTNYKTIAVIGPNAADARTGSYSGEPLYKVSVLDGIKERAGKDANVLYARGCQIIKNLPASSMDAWKESGMPEFPTAEENKTDIDAAIATAKQADVVVLVLGENEFFGRESWGGKHIGDRSSLDLPGAQNELAQAIFALGKPTVVYLMNGRPLAIPQIIDKAGAVVEGWYAGQETGHAAADVLFGDVNPSGKLTITVPRSLGQLPVYYNAKPGSRIYDYVDETNKPLFPFGFGLSYSTFTVSNPTLSAPEMKTDGNVQVTTTVTNTGKVAGDQIVQLYVHPTVSSVTRPVKELRGFQRVSLAAGESKTVTLTIDHESLAFHDIHMNRVVEPGTVEVMVGTSSVDLKTVKLKVTK